MKNMTPVILVMLLLTSFLAGMDMHELEEQVVIEDTGARSGADPSVVAITTPKESTCNDLGCATPCRWAKRRRSLRSSRTRVLRTSPNCRTRSIYLTDSSGAVMGVAKDPSGNDLIWENNDVMCDDATVCDYDGSTNPLTSGAFLGGGKLTLQRLGADITWTPTQGEYLVEVAVDSPTDIDTANNAELVYVIVEDWYDVEVDLVCLTDRVRPWKPPASTPVPSPATFRSS